MTVAELIKDLQTMPQGASVRIVSADISYGGDVHDELTEMRLVRGLNTPLVVLGASTAMCCTRPDSWVSRYEANKAKA